MSGMVADQRTDPRGGVGLRRYLRAVVGAGALVLLASAFRAVHAPYPLGWIAIGVLTMATFAIRVNFSSVSANMAIDDTFFITSALLFGPGPATLTIAVSSCLYSCQRRMPTRQITFNTAATAVSMWSGAQVFFSSPACRRSRSPSRPSPRWSLPLVAFTVVYFALNSGLTAVAVGLDTRQSPLDVWRRNFRWLWVGYLGAGVGGVLSGPAASAAQLHGGVMVLPLLAIFHLTLRATFGRLDDARRHLGDMDRLYLSTVETLAMAIDAKDDVTHSHVRRVQAYAVGLARALEHDRRARR